jgi:hypothetical protein
LDLAEWREESFVLGEKLTWHEFIRLAEDAKGACVLYKMIHSGQYNTLITIQDPNSMSCTTPRRA